MQSFVRTVRRMVRCGLFCTMAFTIITSRIKYVFDCSAQFQGTSLNDVLFQGPDLTNNLVGVLIRFRQEPVTVMGDVQSIFHQVCAPEADQDLLWFLWWPHYDFSKKLEEY